MQKIFGNLSRFPRIQPHPMGDNDTDTCINRQPFSDKILLDKNYTTRTLECLQLRPSIYIPNHARSRLPEHGSVYPLTTRTHSKKVQLKLKDDILTSPIEVNLQSSDVADEEQLFFLPDEEEESEQEIVARKALSKQRAQEEHEKDLSTKVTEVIKIPLNSAVYSFGANK